MNENEPILQTRVVQGNLEAFSVDCFSLHTEMPINFLVLHGAGKADRRRMYPVCERLARRGFTSWTFDFYGHGDSSVKLSTTTLRDRSEQALVVAQQIGAPLGIISFSMGGQTAVDLLQYDLDIRQLVLFAPAAYDVAAEVEKFGPEFSAVIRRPNSWRSSASFLRLESFVGGLTLVWGTEDKVIPRDLVDLLHGSALRAKSREAIILEGAPHTLSGWFMEDPNAADEIMAKIIDRINQVSAL